MYIKYFIIQAKIDGLYLTQDLNFTHDVRKAGKLYDIQEAIDTATYNLDCDFIITSNFEMIN